MAGPLLRILIRLKHNKYHRIQIAARYRIIDLIKQIASDLHLSVDQLVHISIFRNGPNRYALLYPSNSGFGNPHYDVSMTLDKFGLSPNEELYIDLSDIFCCQEQDTTENTLADDSLGATSLSSSESSLTPSTNSMLNSNESPLQQYQPSLLPHSKPQAKTTSSLSTSSTKPNKPLVGQLIRFSVPADNSCLFSSIYFVLHSGKMDLTSNKYLRNLVANKIESDQTTYSEAMLGRTNSDYCKWIRRDDSWGGGIELAILTQVYEIEICVINTECGGRIDYFGEDRHFPYRVFLLYNDLHYDPVYHLTFDVVEQKELLQTKFHRSDEGVLALAKDLIEQLTHTDDEIDHSMLTTKQQQQQQKKKKPHGAGGEPKLMHVQL